MAQKLASGKGMLDPERGFPGQQGPIFTCNLMDPKICHGGGGARPTSERMPFLNCHLGVLQSMPGGHGGTCLLWRLPSQATGKLSALDKANGPEKRWLGNFFGSGTRMAAELQVEIAHARALQVGALGAMRVTVPPKSTLSDVPGAGFGYRASMVQKQVLD